jgi:hypothetical protein
MSIPTPPRVVEQTTRARSDAEAMLRTLLEARVSTQTGLAITCGTRTPSGPGPMDTAIASTERLIDAYDRVLSRFRDGLSDDDLDLLDEIEAKYTA